MKIYKKLSDIRKSRRERMNESVDAEGERGADRARAHWCCGGTDCHTELSAGWIPERAADPRLPDRSPAGEPQWRRRKEKKKKERLKGITRKHFHYLHWTGSTALPHQHLSFSSSQRCQVGGGTSLFAYNGCTRKVGKQKWLARVCVRWARAREWLEPNWLFWIFFILFDLFGVIWMLFVHTCSAGLRSTNSFSDLVCMRVRVCVIACWFCRGGWRCGQITARARWRVSLSGKGAACRSCGWAEEEAQSLMVSQRGHVRVWWCSLVEVCKRESKPCVTSDRDTTLLTKTSLLQSLSVKHTAVQLFHIFWGFTSSVTFLSTSLEIKTIWNLFTFEIRLKWKLIDFQITKAEVGSNKLHLLMNIYKSDIWLKKWIKSACQVSFSAPYFILLVQ